MCRSHSSVSGHARPRTAEEVKTHSYNALEMNKTESYSVVSSKGVKMYNHSFSFTSGVEDLLLILFWTGCKAFQVWVSLKIMQ